MSIFDGISLEHLSELVQMTASSQHNKICDVIERAISAKFCQLNREVVVYADAAWHDGSLFVSLKLSIDMADQSLAGDVHEYIVALAKFINTEFEAEDTFMCCSEVVVELRNSHHWCADDE